MNTRTSTLEWAGFILIALCLGVVQIGVKLIIAQGILFSAAAIVWLIVAIRDGKRPETPAFFLPLLAFAAITLVSAAFSSDPMASFIDSRQLLMFLMVPIVARFVRGERAMQAIDVIIAMGAASALIGIVQFALLGYDNLDNRPRGMLSHWMTFSGLLMMVTCAAIARLLFYPRQIIWPMVAVPALLVALVVTNTRNAWLGTFVAVSVLLLIRNWKFVFLAPIIAGLAFAVAPGLIKQRVQSMVNPSELGAIDRRVMWKVGADMIRDHPVFGMGPEMIDKSYEKYRAKYPEAVNKHNPHLHNVPIQIAAQRGLPALAIFLWFVVVAARDLWRQLRANVAPAVAATGLAALVAMLVAGMLEWNFGDSEFLMLFLGLLTLPWAAARRLPAAANRSRGKPFNRGLCPNTSLLDLIARLPGRRILVIGDVMLDQFLVGRVGRISPEAPVPVVTFKRDEFRLGGAANVAHNVAALGGKAPLVGLVGDDETASELERTLVGAGLESVGLVVDAARPTTRKMRIVTERNQQVGRVDYEVDTDASGTVEARLIAAIGAAASGAHAIVLSDYRKGVVTPAVIAAAVAAARSAGIPLLVDPKVPHAERYTGASLITPNHHEAEVMTQLPIRTIDDARTAARQLHERTGASVLITWGEHGMWVLDTQQGRTTEESLPAAAQEVADVTGAGDTVIAVLALGLAAGASLADAARLANLAAGVVVAHFGPAAPTADELRRAVTTARG